MILRLIIYKSNAFKIVKAIKFTPILILLEKELEEHSEKS